MTPAQIAAVMACTPTYSKWSMASRRALENGIKVEHANGRKAFVRSAAIIQTREGAREMRRGVDVINARTKVGTRIWYLNPDNTVDVVDEWN